MYNWQSCFFENLKFGCEKIRIHLKKIKFMRSEIEITSNVFATEQDSMLIGSDFISIVGKWPVMWLDPADCIPAIEVTSRDLVVASVLESKLKIPWKWEFEIENWKTWKNILTCPLVNWDGVTAMIVGVCTDGPEYFNWITSKFCFHD